MLDKRIGWQFDNTYSSLPESMLSKLSPTPVKAPEIVIFNDSLSKKLGLDFSKISKKELASIFSGNQLPIGSESIAQAYAGHQFGHFTILGDGRALMIGEHITKDNKRYDLQFKGSGKTPYSRNADGRAALGPMLREYIISEAMHGLKVPTTRSLAVVKTGENIIREENLDGAILTRVASSHIRVGTFQYALISNNKNDLKSLFNYTIKRHYPEILKSKTAAVDLLKIVYEKQMSLISEWMRVGFVHGVMNTDNMTISGETIDYGPCAFMDTYSPDTVFSSIDLHGRYAYFNQPAITKWNLERFAESLLPLIDDNREKAIKSATEIMSTFPNRYKKVWITMMKNKLGIIGDDPDDESLISELLSWMHLNKIDYTNTFCFLMDELLIGKEIYSNKQFLSWKKKWAQRRLIGNTIEGSISLMRKSNPLFIPRNHIVEDALKFATELNDLTKVKQFLLACENPYEKKTHIMQYQKVPKPTNKKYQTYCGT
jgi:uncharacterized protein YdiU (UPF0061 family)